MQSGALGQLFRVTASTQNPYKRAFHIVSGYRRLLSSEGETNMITKHSLAAILLAPMPFFLLACNSGGSNPGPIDPAPPAEGEDRSA